MKAVRVHEFGSPEVLKYEDVSDPRPGPGEALIQMQASGINYMDVNGRGGFTPQNLPWIPGGEAAGVVAELGPDVTEVKVGDVVAYTGGAATYAEKTVAPSWRLVKLPEGISPEIGAATMLQGMTAHYLVHSTYPVKPGDRVLIHAGAGGVGLLLIQMAKRLGGYVFTTVSTEAKEAIAKEAGADEVILYSRENFQEAIMKSTNGEGVHVVYDAVGKDTFEGSLGSLMPRGYLALYGQASGAVPPQDVRVFFAKSNFLARPSLGHYTPTREELLWRANDVLGWVKSGELKLRIHDTYPLADAKEAHRQLQGRLTTGKLVLVP